jgi:hypothetical protein
VAANGFNRFRNKNPIEIEPVKKLDGNYFVVRLRSNKVPDIQSITNFPVIGNETDFKYAIDVAIGALAEYQIETCGDEWDIAVLQKEAWKLFQGLIDKWKSQFSTN